MEQDKCDKDEIKHREPKVVFFIWILPILSLFLLTGILLIGIHFLEQDSSISPSRLIRIGVIAVIVAVFLLIVGFMHDNYSIRYMQIPVWRWMASGFKGEPNLPWITKTKKVNAKEKKDPS